MKQSMTIGKLRKLISEVIQDTLRENEDEEGGPGRPRDEPNSPLSRLIEDDPDGAEGVAKDFNVSVAHLNKIARKDAHPSLDLALKIDSKTSGEVPVKSWKGGR